MGSASFNTIEFPFCWYHLIKTEKRFLKDSTKLLDLLQTVEDDNKDNFSIPSNYISDFIKKVNLASFKHT